MRNIFSVSIILILPILVIANMFMFVSGIRLGDQIGHFESETKRLHELNIELQKNTSRVDSYEYASSMAATLDFVKKSNPVVLDNVRYALNRQ